MVLLAGCMGGGGQMGASPTQQTPQYSPERETGNESVDPVLVDLIESENRTRFAEENDLSYRDGRVKVIVELERNASLPSGYNIAVEHTATGSRGELVQAYVDPDDLLRLGSEAGVRYIRTPQSAVSS